MSHPLRARVLRSLGEAPGSPSELARRLEDIRPEGQSHSTFTSNISHHIDYLVRLGCVEEAESEGERRGNLVLRVYRAIEAHLVETDEWEDLAAEAKDELRRDFAQVHIDDLVLWLRGGGGLDKFFALYRDHYNVDQEGLENMIEIFEEQQAKIEAEVARAAERLGESGEKPKRVSSLQGCIEIPIST
jgi:uncharacterized tellurite resistance protein B-like protein